jgi:hypothetical protein
MTDPSDANWDELGIAWRVIDPNIGVVSSRLAARLRRQSRWISTGMGIGLALCAVGMLLGVGTIGIGLSSGAWNFVTRGFAMIAISAILMLPVWSLQSVGEADAASDLSQMIDLAIGRAQKALSLTKAALYSCGIAAVFGTAGTAIRRHLGRPPRMSLIVDLLILALVAWVIFLYGRRMQAELGKYKMLKQALAVDGGA